MNRTCTGTNSEGARYGPRYERRERTAPGLKADAEQAALGARGQIPDRKNFAARGATPAAGAAPEQGFDCPRSLPAAADFARALSAFRLRRGLEADLFGFCACLRAAPNIIYVP